MSVWKGELFECLQQILFEVAYVFDADAEADKAVIDASGFAQLAWNAGVSHCRRMAGERFDAAEAFGEREDF